MTTATSHPPAAVAAQLLTTDAVARRLKVDPSTVRRWIDDGRLPAVKPGRHYRIDPADLDDFLAVSSTSRRVSQPLTGDRPAL